MIWLLDLPTPYCLLTLDVPPLLQSVVGVLSLFALLNHPQELVVVLRSLTLAVLAFQAVPFIEGDIRVAGKLFVVGGKVAERRYEVLAVKLYEAA